MSYRASRPIPFQSREMPYQFRASKALRGLGMLRRGLGDMATYDQYLGLENCGTLTDVASQYACSQRNTIKENSGAYQNDPCSPHNVDYSNPATIPTQCGGPVTTGTGNTYTPPTYTPAYTPPPAPTYNPRLSFVTSRGGSTLYPGDTWTISITGAAPNQPVSVLGVHPDGGSATQGYGNTDGSGNWQLQGTITADMVGNWKETWSVGGTQVGQFSFTVAQPQQQQLPQVPAATVPTGGPVGTMDSSSGFSFSAIPWWGWGLAAVGGFMLLGGGHGR